MCLNRLSLSDLMLIVKHLDELLDVGCRLECVGLLPMFDLTPGQPTRITLPVILPGVEAAAAAAAVLPQTDDDVWRKVQMARDLGIFDNNDRAHRQAALDHLLRRRAMEASHGLIDSDEIPAGSPVQSAGQVVAVTAATDDEDPDGGVT